MTGGTDGTSRVLRARWIFPGTAPPIANARLTVADGLIVGVESGPARPGDLDLGDVAIVPGFVNAHTHLELGPIDWMRRAAPRTRWPGSAG